MTSKLTEIDGQINDVNNQHTETKKKIKELEKIKKPNLFEQEQLDGLIKTNDEFERKLRWHILIHKFCWKIQNILLQISENIFGKSLDTFKFAWYTNSVIYKICILGLLDNIMLYI